MEVVADEADPGNRMSWRPDGGEAETDRGAGSSPPSCSPFARSSGVTKHPLPLVGTLSPDSGKGCCFSPFLTVGSPPVRCLT